MASENEVAPVTPNSPLSTLVNMRQALVNVAATMRATGGDPFLRLLRDGSWVYGAENIEVEQGSHWAINPNSLQHGYCCWSKGDDNDAGELLGEAMVSMFSPKPNLDDLPKYGFPWAEQIAFNLRCTNGEDEGVQVQYKVTSKGGMNAARVLLQQLIRQVDADPANLVPLIELQSSTYQHKKWGRIYTPVLTIIGWSNEQALAGDEPDEPKAEKKKAPVASAADAEGVRHTVVKRRTSSAAAPPPAAAARRGKPAPEPAKPVRRRRPS